MVYGTDLNIPIYQGIINTVFAACEAARMDDLTTLKQLNDAGVDLNLGDYDMSSPLFYAVKTNHLDIA